MKNPQTGDRSYKEAFEIIKAGHPPMANKIALVDFDGTLAPFGFLFSYPDPIFGAREAMEKLYNAGYKIWIFTSRLSAKWLASVNQTADQHIDYIKEFCASNGIIIEGVTGEKMPAELYIDDKAYRFDGDWASTISQIMG